MKLPLMKNLAEITGLAPILEAHKIATPISDFETFYDDLATQNENPRLLLEVESTVRAYFSNLKISDDATLYDYLLLSLREKDLIATFNWDPFLAQAYRRNLQIRKLPQIAFLHGNVEVGACSEHNTKGFIFQACSRCAKPLTPTRLLYPVKQKDYSSDAFIKNEWATVGLFLKHAYMVTIFGYSAPTTDIEARTLMLDKWLANASIELAQISIVDVRGRADLEAAWRDFFVRQNYGICDDVLDTFQFCHPRRSCDALAMANLQQQPWSENRFPRFKELWRLHQWIQPLLDEEERGTLTGKICH